MTVKIPNAFYGKIVLVGTNGDKVPLNFLLGKVAPGTFEYTQAVNALNQIRSGLAAVTDANIALTAIEATFTVDETLPESPVADLTKAAVVNVLTVDADGDVDKATIYIPAPSSGIFVGTTGEAMDQLDTQDADLINYVQQIAQHAFISDGEQIDTSLGYDGMNPKNPGGRISRAKNLYK